METLPWGLPPKLLTPGGWECPAPLCCCRGRSALRHRSNNQRRALGNVRFTTSDFEGALFPHSVSPGLTRVLLV